MSLKRRTQLADTFSMASMTDVIFLLLIFFLVASTIIVPNVIKVSLPSATAQPSSEQAHARIIISPEGTCYLGLDKAPEVPLTLPDIEMQLGAWAMEHPEAFVVIHADEVAPYRLVVSAISVASKANLKVVLATKVTEEAVTAL